MFGETPAGDDAPPARTDHDVMAYLSDVLTEYAASHGRALPTNVMTGALVLTIHVLPDEDATMMGSYAFGTGMNHYAEIGVLTEQLQKRLRYAPGDEDSEDNND